EAQRPGSERAEYDMGQLTSMKGDGKSVISAAQVLVDGEVYRFGEESNRTIAEQEVGASGMEAAKALAAHVGVIGVDGVNGAGEAGTGATRVIGPIPPDAQEGIPIVIEIDGANPRREIAVV